MKTLQTNFLLKDSERTESTYYEMLEVLHPRMQATNAFLVGEPYDHCGENGNARYELYFIENGKYYFGGLTTVAEFMLFCVKDQSLLNCDANEAVAWQEKAKTGAIMRII